MSLPEGWVTSTVGECSHAIQYGLTCTSSSTGEGHRYIRITDIQYHNIDWTMVPFANAPSEVADAYQIQKGDLLFARTGATVGKSYLVRDVPEKAAFASYLIRVCCDKSVMLPDFAAFYFRSPIYWQQIQEGAEGTGQPNFNGTKLSGIYLNVPPLAEQYRIVAKLDILTARLARARGELSRVKALCDQIKQSVLEAAFDGRLGSSACSKDHWLYMPSSEVCERVQSGGTPKSGFSESGIPFLKVYNIVNQNIDFEYRAQYIHRDIHTGELKKSIAQKGDVLMNIVGPPLGKVAIINSPLGQCNINQALVLFRPTEKISSEWIYYFLRSGRSVRSVVQETRGIAGQVNISLSQCRAFSFPVPPTYEQDTIVRKIEATFARCERLEAEAARARVLLDRLESAILAKAFRGELVPQDPNDEPASVLIDRIRAKRAAAPKPKRGRRVAADT